MASLNHVAITRRRQELLGSIAAVTSTQLARRWNALPEHDEAQQARWATLAHPIITSGQNRAIDIQAAYLGARLGNPVPFDRAGLLAQAAVDPLEPFTAFANALAKGSAPVEALLSGALRAQGLGESAVFWAARATNTAVTDERVVGWQRTLTAKACDWCTQVAGQIYKTAESASFGHLRCDCGVDPVIGGSNPGRLINDALARPDRPKRAA